MDTRILRVTVTADYIKLETAYAYSPAKNWGYAVKVARTKAARNWAINWAAWRLRIERKVVKAALSIEEQGVSLMTVADRVSYWNTCEILAPYYAGYHHMHKRSIWTMQIKSDGIYPKAICANIDKRRAA